MRGFLAKLRWQLDQLAYEPKRTNALFRDRSDRKQSNMGKIVVATGSFFTNHEPKSRLEQTTRGNITVLLQNIMLRSDLLGWK